MTAEWSQWSKRHGQTVDVIVAILLCAMATYASRLAIDVPGRGPVVVRPASLAVFDLSALASITLLWRRRFPIAVLAITTACGVAIGAIGFDVSVLTAGAAFVAAYSLGLWSSDLRTAKIVPVVSGAALLITSLLEQFDPVVTGGRITLVAGVLVAGAFAEAGRSRRNYLAALHARAELAERTREEEARQRVAEERLRIARELHDIVAHHMVLAHAQASTAAYLSRSQPDQAQEILDQLAGTTSAALRELRATVGLLRDDDDSDVPLEPTPGLAQLPELLATFEQAGLTVSMSAIGARRPLSPVADLTAYRTIQEALTNVTKHAGTASAAVALVYSELLLTISVTDDGGKPSDHTRGEQRSESAGYGLIGMKERAASVGGYLHAGRRPDAGFEVTIELPLETSKESDD
ncbi:sensor histidine kinase [Nocardia pseudovaccinii]|uniref:sensor histidine kinase n=1 Tax=Nocardia pseudovaccinii TaxID=189540 RepID=UPI003D8C6FD7